jgi:hypothetical protein
MISKTISKTFRLAGVIALASLALSSAAGAACSNDSLRGTYGFQHDGTDSTGAPATAAITQITFDPATGTFTAETTASHGGQIATSSLTGTYAIAPDCTGTGTPTGAIPFAIVVTSTGFLALHAFSEGFAVKQGTPACNNATVVGSFGFQSTGLFLAGAPTTGWVAFIGRLRLTVNSSGEGVISGHAAGSEGDTALALAPVTGSYSIASDCTGTATITMKGQSPMNFSFVVVDCGKQMLAVETDTNTIVSGTLVKNSDDKDEPEAMNIRQEQNFAQIAQSQKIQRMRASVSERMPIGD